MFLFHDTGITIFLKFCTNNLSTLRTGTFTLNCFFITFKLSTNAEMCEQFWSATWQHKKFFCFYAVTKVKLFCPPIYSQYTFVTFFLTKWVETRVDIIIIHKVMYIVFPEKLSQFKTVLKRCVKCVLFYCSMNFNLFSIFLLFCIESSNKRGWHLLYYGEKQCPWSSIGSVVSVL